MKSGKSASRCSVAELEMRLGHFIWRSRRRGEGLQLAYRFLGWNGLCARRESTLPLLPAVGVSAALDYFYVERNISQVLLPSHIF